jgi:hypothetical protein
MARFAGDLGDEQTVGISPGTILVHYARIEHGYVIGKLNSSNETGLRPMRRTCGCPWSACPRRHRGHPGRDPGRAPALREPARRFMKAETRHLGGPLGAASVMARRSEGARRTHHRGGRPTAVNRQVMTPKFLLSFPRLKPSLPESPGGQREAVPAGHG